MRLIKIKPDTRLAKYIEFYWLMESMHTGKLHTSMLPATAPEIVFNLTSSNIYMGAGSNVQTTPGIELIGSFNTTIPVFTEQPFTLLGIRFFPAAMHCCFHTNMQHLINQSVEASCVAGDEIEQLQEQLYEASCLTKRVSLLNGYLLHKFYKHNLEVDKFFSFFNWVQKTDAGITVEKIACKLGYSYRYTQKLFHRYIGISPQQYVQIKRLHNAILLMNSSEKSLTEIAYHCGYADQSHFIRTFKSFIGQTPLQFRKEKTGINLLKA